MAKLLSQGVEEGMVRLEVCLLFATNATVTLGELAVEWCKVLLRATWCETSNHLKNAKISWLIWFAFSF